MVRDKLDHIVRVEEEDILSATALIWSRMKLQIEPSAGVGVAAAISEDFREIVGKFTEAKAAAKAEAATAHRNSLCVATVRDAEVKCEFRFNFPRDFREILFLSETLHPEAISGLCLEDVKGPPRTSGDLMQKECRE